MTSPPRDDSSIYNELNLSPTRGFPSILLKLRGATKDCAIELEPESSAPHLDLFSTIPIELCLHILSFVEQPWYLCDISRVSSHWNMLASENKLWYSFYIKYRFVLEETDEQFATAAGYWKNKFKDKYQRITPWYHNKFKEDTYDNPFSTLCRIHVFSEKALVAVQLVKVSLVDAETFQEKDSSHTLSIASCSIPSRSMIVLIGDHVQILKVDCSSMKFTTLYETPFNFVSRDSFAHNREVLACTQNDTIWILHLDSFESQTLYTEHPIVGIFVEAQGQYTPQNNKKKSKVGAVLANGSLIVWDLATSEAVVHITEDTIMNHAGMTHHPVSWKVVQCAFLKNDLLILGMDQGRMQIWNLVTKSCVDTIQQAHSDTITFFEETSYDELFLSASQDGIVKTWNINSLKQVEGFILIHVPEFMKSFDGVRVRDVISVDTRLCAISHMGKVKMWDIRTGKIMFVATLQNASLLACNDSFLVYGSLSKITIRNFQQTQTPSLQNSAEIPIPKIVSVSSVGKRKRPSKPVSPPPLILLDDSDAEELLQLQEFRKQHAAWLVEDEYGEFQQQ